ncbi:glycosyltransferase family 2 protein [Salegentibacter sp. BDJ18]|uniref:glycosyltransferase family 2 protein n=1 Tax=Salegentibacter sp. BDJ18 TaxID=2816376 RepID=UPI0031F73C6C|nr:glycosyltransferase family 2 protein [Salegentibacter sp. BDJ18]
MQPLVSIIIPTYNRSSLLGETLDSVLAQTYTYWECIIVDDGSTDYTAELLKFYLRNDSRIRVLKREDDRLKGANACRNIGFENSLGKFLIFLDSDDVLAKNCLAERVKVAEKIPQYSFYVFKMQSFLYHIGDLDRIININRENDESYIEMLLKHKIPWPLTALFIKRPSFISFDEDLKRFQDVLFSLKLTIFNDQFKILDIPPDCFYRNDANNKLKYKNPQFQKIIFESFLKFLKICERDIFNDLKDPVIIKKYKSCLVKAFKEYLVSYAFLHKREHKNLINEIFKFLNKNNYLTNSERLKLFVVNFIFLKEQYIIKGVGLYRLSQMLAKK